MKFKAVIDQPDLLRDSINAVSTLINEAVFKVKKSGIELRAMDSANVSMVEMRLLASAFRSFDVDKETEIAVNIGASREEFTPAQRKSIKDLQEQEERADILGTIVQVFDLKFFENQYGASYVFNVILDDGTDTIRCAFFKIQADRLAGKKPEEMQKYKENPEAFAEVKNELLGQIIKCIGKVKINEMFNRKEFTVQLVDRDPSPQEELKREQGTPSF